VDVVGIGNAIVDALAEVSEAALGRLGLAKGAMTLVDDTAARELGAAVAPKLRRSGGSAANTMVGIASLGGAAGFLGKVGEDETGRLFVRDLEAAGVRCGHVQPSAAEATGTCLVLVTPDAQRTMATFLGASASLGPDDVDEAFVAGARIVYLEGYLWDRAPAKAAFRRAAEIAHRAGRQVALTLSDPFCVGRHRADFQALVAEHVDVLLANEHEALALWVTGDLETAIDRLGRAGRCSIAAITCSARGSIVLAGGRRHEVPAHPVARVVDTTGAGDLYAAGFLHGLAGGRSPEECGRLGSLAAAEVIGHFGARPEVGLAGLVARHGLGTP
jgi:sugar/nucleoside kinase (ribokinase family)